MWPYTWMYLKFPVKICLMARRLRRISAHLALGLMHLLWWEESSRAHLLLQQRWLTIFSPYKTQPLPVRVSVKHRGLAFPPCMNLPRLTSPKRYPPVGVLSGYRRWSNQHHLNRLPSFCCMSCLWPILVSYVSYLLLSMLCLLLFLGHCLFPPTSNSLSSCKGIPRSSLFPQRLVLMLVPRWVWLPADWKTPK